MFRVVGRGVGRSPLAGAVLVPAAVGLAVGFLAALGWRFAVPRVYFDADPPPPDMAPTDIGYIQVFDYQLYVDGPGWWPSVAALPALGFALGISVGFAVQAATGQRRRPGVAAALVITGLLTGVAGALYAGQWTPELTVRAVRDPTYAAAPLPPGTSFDDTVVGAPPRWELGPAAALFPTMGLVVGSACGAVRVALHRRRNS